MKKNYPLLLIAVMCCLHTLLPAQSINSCFILEIDTPTAGAGETVCVDVSARNFDNILGLQLTTQWDPTDLEYLAIENINVPGLNMSSFGTEPNLVDNGLLSLAYFDQGLTGISMPDDAVLFSICFEVLASGLDFLPVNFTNSPTIYEAVAIDSDTGGDIFLSFNLINGGVAIGPDPVPSPVHITDGCVVNGSCMESSLASIDISVEGGQIPYTFDWSGPGNYSNTTEDIDGLSEGWYILTVTDANGIATSAEFFVGSAGILSSTADATVLYCDQGDIGSIDLSPMGGSGNYSYIWSNGATTEDIDNLAPGDYTVTITDNDSGCDVVDTYTIAYQDFLWNYSFACNGSAATINAGVFLGGEAPYTFEWSNGTTEITSNTSSITAPANNEYFATVTDQTGCSTVIGPMIADCGVNNNNSLTIYGTHHTAAVDEIVCVDVLVQGFTDVVSAQFSMNWDPASVEFVGVQNFNIENLDEINFGITDENEDGILRVSWIHLPLTGLTVPDNSSLFQVCYRVLDDQNGTNISFTDSPIPVEFTNVNQSEIPYNTLAGSINIGVVEPTPAINLNIEDAYATPDSPVCVSVAAATFTDVASLDLDIGWDPLIIAFDEIQVGNLPELSISDFDLEFTATGSISLNWQGSGSVSLPANTPLFDICFTTIGDLNTSTEVIFSDNSTAQDVDGNDLTFNHDDGSVSILEGNGSDLTFEFSNEMTFPDEFVCVDVSVVDFTSVLAFQFPIHWDPAVIEFQGVQNFNLEGLSEANFGLTDETEEGTLRVSWLDVMGLEGETLPNGTSIFQICFEAVGELGSSTPIFIDNTPIPNEAVIYDLPADIVLEANQSQGSVTISENFVWPGDADNNEEVNHFDLLPIGIGFGTSGPTRNDASLVWEEQNAFNWVQQTPNSFINFKHLDTDGNGLINALDTQAIIQNWGETVNNFTDDPNDNNLADLPDAFSPINSTIYLMPDTFALGASVGMDIIMGEEGSPADNIYGIAFSIVYDTHAIVDESVFVTFEDSWLGEEGVNMIAISRNNPDESRIDIAITRTDGQNITGSGKIGVLNITIEDVIIRSNFYEMEMDIKDIRIINAQEELKGIIPRKTRSFIDLANSIYSYELNDRIRLFPNPAKSIVYLQAGELDMDRIQLYSIEGQLLATYSNTNQIPVKSLTPGNYVLRIITDQGLAIKKFVKID